MNFKVGDWVIHDYEIKQVIAVEETPTNRVTEVSCGYFNTSGNHLICFPLTLANKRVADNITTYCDRLREENGSRDLNWPDINRYFCQKTAEAIEGDADKVFEEVNNFVKTVTDSLRDRSSKQTNGLRIFR